ncbi:hypothetical protein Tco_1206331 [Tanacetum coccineum]
MASESLTTKHVTPVLNVTFECEKGDIAFNNDIALLEHKNPLYKPMLKFLSNCCVCNALTKQPLGYYLEYLRELWYSDEVDAATNTTTFTLPCSEKPLSFDLDDFSTIIGLKYSENYEALLPKETVRAGLATLGLQEGQRTASFNKNPSASKVHLISHMLTMAKLSDAEKTLLISYGEVNANSTIDKSLSGTTVQSTTQSKAPPQFVN